MGQELIHDFDKFFDALRNRDLFRMCYFEYVTQVSVAVYFSEWIVSCNVMDQKFTKAYSEAHGHFLTDEGRC